MELYQDSAPKATRGILMSMSRYTAIIVSTTYIMFYVRESALDILCKTTVRELASTFSVSSTCFWEVCISVWVVYLRMAQLPYRSWYSTSLMFCEFFISTYPRAELESPAGLVSNDSLLKLPYARFLSSCDLGLASNHMRWEIANICGVLSPIELHLL